MALNLENELLIGKTRELCQTIVELPEFRAIRRQIDAFLADETAKKQYQLVAEKGEHLHHKQHQGVTLSTEEIADYEQHREALVSNPVAREFLAAQEEVHKVQESIGRYVAKTLELGHVPEPGDMESCGHDCSCHH